MTTARLGTKFYAFHRTNKFTIVIHNNPLLRKRSGVNKIYKNEMGGACGSYGGRERCAQGFGGETWGKETIVETKT